jgi:hypothetical protein
LKRSAISAALLTAAVAISPLAALADNDWGQGGFGRAGYHEHDLHASGTIAEVRGGRLRLQDGRPVFLHRGTVIDPTGITLRPGMRIRVSGSPRGNGAIDADVIEVARGYGNGPWNGGANWNQDGAGNGGQTLSVPDHSEQR